jgi:hypothetical protein
MNIIVGTLHAAFQGLSSLKAQLPAGLSDQLSNRITTILAEGFTVATFRIKDDDALKILSDKLKVLPGDIIQTISDKMFGHIDLKALSGKDNDAVKGFDALMQSLTTMGVVIRESGVNMNHYTGTIEDFAQATVGYFKKFQKDGEAFTDTVKRIGEALMSIISITRQIDQEIAGLTHDMSVVVSSLQRVMQAATDQVARAADDLTIAIESGSSPEEVTKVAQAAIQAVTQAYQQQTQIATQLHDALLAVNKSITDGVDFVVSLTQKISSLRGGETNISDIQSEINMIDALFNQLGDVTSRIALFSAELVGMAENMTVLTANIPLVTQNFNTIVEQIRQMNNATEALAALKALSSAIETGLQAAIAAVNRETQARVAELTAEKTAIQNAIAAQISALNSQKAELAKVYDQQKQALQDQLSLAKEWSNVLAATKSQLTDLFNLLAPTHPIASLNEVRQQFEDAFAQFKAKPTPEGATRVQELVKQLLELAKQTPGYELPSKAFQDLVAEIQAALLAIQGIAGSQPTPDDIQAKIAELDKQQVEKLAAIDKQISELNNSQTAQLAAIDQQIADTQAAGQAQIKQFQDLAASSLEAIRAQTVLELQKLSAQQAEAAKALQAVLGDKTFEQFMAEKQNEAITALQGINETLKNYLGSLLSYMFPGAEMPVSVPSHAEGLTYVPYDNYTARLHRGERVLTASENAHLTNGGGQTTIVFSPQITVTGTTNARKLADELEDALVEKMQTGSRLRQATRAISERRG